MLSLLAWSHLPLDTVLAAASGPSFPRGEGFYFSLIKLPLVAVVYLCWVRTAWWVDQDARALALPTGLWNPLMLVAGLVGLLAVWSLPWFVFSFVVLLLLYLAPSLSYVYVRNEKVPPEDRVLTERHLRQLLRLAPRKEDGGPTRQGVPVRFMTKGASRGQGDGARA